MGIFVDQIFYYKLALFSALMVMAYLLLYLEQDSRTYLNIYL